mmetsp:Transcript_13789/g.32898  ORF Transcript_13789/g.32898 Transcript_13789/m.32898 type:complete len:233 (-) Transcript_13789:776-1474(-)
MRHLALRSPQAELEQLEWRVSGRPTARGLFCDALHLPSSIRTPSRGGHRGLGDALHPRHPSPPWATPCSQRPCEAPPPSDPGTHPPSPASPRHHSMWQEAPKPRHPIVCRACHPHPHRSRIRTQHSLPAPCSASSKLCPWRQSSREAARNLDEDALIRLSGLVRSTAAVSSPPGHALAPQQLQLGPDRVPAPPRHLPLHRGPPPPPPFPPEPAPLPYHHQAIPLQPPFAAAT